MNEKTVSTSGLSEKMISCDPVSKTVKGGRKRKFSVLMVVGDGNGCVGVGMGKSAEVPDAVSKAVQDAKKNLVKVTLRGTTIPHDVVAEYGSSLVVLKPAAEGSGVRAGGAVRDVLEMAGVKDVKTKALRSRNPKNLAKATLKGLLSLRDVEQIAEVRGKSTEEILG